MQFCLSFVTHPLQFHYFEFMSDVNAFLSLKFYIARNTAGRHGICGNFHLLIVISLIIFQFLCGFCFSMSVRRLEERKVQSLMMTSLTWKR